MQRHIRLLLTSLAATAILAAAVSSASAREFALSNQQFRAVWTSLELSNNVTSDTVRCAVTLEGSFHSRTIAKIPGRLIGYVTRAAVQNTQCTGGNATILNETLPWHITYSGTFRGTLPRITEILINLIRAGFIVRTPSNTCRSVTEIERPARGIINRNTTTGQVEGITADPTAGISLTNGPGGALCGFGTGFFSNTARVRLLGTECLIFITLI